ncbi:Uncharacterized protein HSBGL_1037 [Halapricum desulfuricans]|uniref:Uncharacterized protein n=1 Tax=Halapricum desulfuricans TaxID=2841257 RepID=A0A897NGA2_9EURY|nr:hypothetical protein [Halapricum desulfuricans]QSG11464.1 Uncharacterized protein HSBGL_1037 [Halapricum desulfuricans]
MESRLYRTTLFALYQLTVLVGIALLPVALVARRAGVPVPVHRAIDRLEAAYERTTEQA